MCLRRHMAVNTLLRANSGSLQNENMIIKKKKQIGGGKGLVEKPK